MFFISRRPVLWIAMVPTRMIFIYFNGSQHCYLSASSVCYCIMSFSHPAPHTAPVQISEAVSQFFRKLPGCTLINDYGPSETHVVTSYRMPRSRDLWQPLPPIGTAISNTQLFIVDAHANRVPIGVSLLRAVYFYCCEKNDSFLRTILSCVCSLLLPLFF